MAKRRSVGERTPLLEWIAAAIGLLLVLAMLAVLGNEASTGEAHETPAISVAATRVVQTPTGFVVEFEARNDTRGTAADVEVEGVLTPAAGKPETSTASIDYVPGQGRAEGGLFFRNDPRSGQLELRALGYRAP